MPTVLPSALSSLRSIRRTRKYRRHVIGMAIARQKVLNPLVVSDNSARIAGSFFDIIHANSIGCW